MAKKRAKAAAKKPKAGTSKASAAERKRLYIEAICANGGNGRQAAIDAGAKPGRAADKYHERMSRDVAAQQAIAARRAETFAKASERTMVTAEEILLDMSDAMRFDPAELYKADGSLKNIQDIPLHVRQQLEGVEFEEISVRGKVIGRVGKFKFPKRHTTREQAMKHFGLFKADNMQKQASPLAALPLDLQHRIYERLVARGFLVVNGASGQPNRGPVSAGEPVGSLPGPAPVPAI